MRDMRISLNAALGDRRVSIHDIASDIQDGLSHEDLVEFIKHLETDAEDYNVMYELCKYFLEETLTSSCYTNEDVDELNEVIERANRSNPSIKKIGKIAESGKKKQPKSKENKKKGSRFSDLDLV